VGLAARGRLVAEYLDDLAAREIAFLDEYLAELAWWLARLALLLLLLDALLKLFEALGISAKSIQTSDGLGKILQSMGTGGLASARLMLNLARYITMEKKPSSLDLGLGKEKGYKTPRVFEYDLGLDRKL